MEDGRTEEKGGERMANSKNRIIDSTIRILGENGLNCPMSLVAEDVGCSDTLIFRYFKKKELLLDICFHKVCHSILERLRSVEFPEELDDDTFLEYVRGIWDEYMGFLMDQPEMAAFYLQYSWSKGPFPSGYKRPDDVVRKVLGDNSLREDFKEDFLFICNYIALVANSIATGMRMGWGRMDASTADRVFDFIAYGVAGRKG